MEELIFTKESRLVIDPGEDEVLKEFGTSDHLMIPFQSVGLISDDNPNAGSLKLFRDSEAGKVQARMQPV